MTKYNKAQNYLLFNTFINIETPMTKLTKSSRTDALVASRNVHTFVLTIVCFLNEKENTKLTEFFLRLILVIYTVYMSITQCLPLLMHSSTSMHLDVIE